MRRVDPAQVIDHLNRPGIVPAWMSYAEARRGRLSLFNDIVWADVAAGTAANQDVPRKGSHRVVWRRHRR